MVNWAQDVWLVDEGCECCFELCVLSVSRSTYPFAAPLRRVVECGSCCLILGVRPADRSRCTQFEEHWFESAGIAKELAKKVLSSTTKKVTEYLGSWWRKGKSPNFEISKRIFPFSLPDKSSRATICQSGFAWGQDSQSLVKRLIFWFIKGDLGWTRKGSQLEGVTGVKQF